LSHHAIDCHTHVVPENFPAYAGKNVNVPWPSMAPAHACHRHVMISGKNYRTVSDGSWSVPRRIEGMGGMRIARQALSPMPELLSYWLPAEDAQVLLRYINDTIAAMVDAAPGRFIGLGAIPLQDMDLALKELEYVKHTLKFSGVEIASHVNGVSIGDARFEPFFAAAEKMGASIFVHALRPAGQDRIVGALSEQAVAFPGDIGLAAAAIITGGIAARHPNLKIAFSHGGGALSVMLPRLAHAWRMTPKALEQMPESPEVYARRFFYDCVVFDPLLMRVILERYGASQILVGSDYPFAMGEGDPIGLIDRCGFDAATVQAITHDNALRFLGLPA
jgi:aminocarboxymuconate-semialdehyde decarboxylase